LCSERCSSAARIDARSIPDVSTCAVPSGHTSDSVAKKAASLPARLAVKFSVIGPATVSAS
jgi:hypothetical protein